MTIWSRVTVTAGPPLHLPPLWSIFRGEMFNLLSDAPVSPGGKGRIFLEIISVHKPLGGGQFIRGASGERSQAGHLLCSVGNR